MTLTDAKSGLRGHQGMFSDCDAGLYTLPEPVLSARAAADRLEGELADLQPPDVEQARAQAVSALCAAAAAGKPLPSTNEVGNAEEGVAEFHRRRNLLSEARDSVLSTLVTTISERQDEIIVEHMRPAHDAAVQEFIRATDLIPENFHMDWLLRASDEIRQTWLQLDETARIYGRVVDAASRLQRRVPKHDVDGEFAVMRNIKEVWPIRQAGRTPPWKEASDNRRLQLLWLVRHGADLWLPTIKERDDAWWAKYGEALRARQASRQQAEAYGALLARS